MYNYNSNHLAPSSISPSTPRIKVTNDIDESAKVAWAAQILSDYTRQMQRESYHDYYDQDIEENRDSSRGEEETEEEEGDTFYQMCYMPIVLACILIGALMIGVVIYFVEDNPAVTTDNPVNE